MNKEPIIILSRSQVRELLSIEESIKAVENAFKLYGEGKVLPPGILGIHAKEGGFHIKAGLMNLGKGEYFVAKTNANFPGNPVNNNLPTIQGVVLVMNATNGQPLALLDSIELTILRTGAATAVATKYLSKADSKVATIIGCGEQGNISIQMVSTVRDLEKVYVYDTNQELAYQLAADFKENISISVVDKDNLKETIRCSDICVTCTPSRSAFVSMDYVTPGTFIAAVGADNEEKQELDPELLASSLVVTDLTEQSASIGELHHALDKNVMTQSDVYAELGEIVAGKKPGRLNDNQTFIFDSTGMALQDVASAAVVYEKALAKDVISDFSFAS